MKNLSLSLVTLVFSLTTVFANTDYSPIIKIRAAEEGKAVNLFMSNLQGETTYIEVVDEEGHAIYSKTISRRRSFGTKLNLAQLEDGKYELRIGHTRLNVMQPVLIEDNHVSVFSSARSEKATPFINYTDRLLEFQLAKQPKPVNTRLEILDGETVIYTMEELMSDKMVKQFKLDQLTSGEYTFRVAVADDVYYKSIELR